MWATQVLQTSRTTYRGVRGSGAGQSLKTSARSSSASRPTQAAAVLSGQVFKRSQRGLFDGALPQSGNVIPKSRQKTARTWRPNVQLKSVWSDILQANLKLHVSTKAMRTMRKMGGLDTYLAKRDGAYLGEMGRSLRNQLGSIVREKQNGVPLDVLREEMNETLGQNADVSLEHGVDEAATLKGTQEALQTEMDRMNLELQNKATLQERIGEASAPAAQQQQQQ